LSLGDKNEQLADAYNITMRLVEMGEHFKRFDLQDVFYIIKTKLHIAELTYTEMIENGSWNSSSTNQDSGFIVNTTCWNCGGKGHRADECPSKKVTNSAIPNKTR